MAEAETMPKDETAFETINDAVKKAGQIHFYEGGYFKTTDDGIYYVKEKNGEDIETFLSSKFEILGQTVGNNNQSWGLYLQWFDPRKNQHQLAIPYSILKSDGVEFRAILLDRGVTISPSQRARTLLLAYVLTFKTDNFIRCVNRIGWHEGVYVLPDGVIGSSNEQVVFQSENTIDPVFQSVLTIEEWQSNVSRLASGNSRLIFAISAALAAPLIDFAGGESGGFHIQGGSSSGKTTALNLAASVWGHPERFSRNWRSTANGLEGLAAIHNDCLLILDELSQINPKDAGEAAYLLANGQGKTRASKSGVARKASSWRLLFLSAGEESLSSMMNSVGKKVNAGQEIRMAEITADAGQGMGMFENLHEYETAPRFANALKEATRKHYGTAGRDWLNKLVKRYKELPDLISRSTNYFAKKEYTGQVARVAKRFGLVALAGELATEAGITGWQEGEAIKAIKQCFDDWLDAFGNGNKEEQSILESIRYFFQSQSDSRLENLNSESLYPIRDKAGYIRTLGEEKEYLIFPVAFKSEFCKIYPQKAVIDVLKKHGWLKLSSENKSTDTRLINGNRSRYYVFNEKAIANET